MSQETPYYKCNRCGNCCRWPGYVRVSNEEINQIADFLNMTPDELIEGFTIVTHDRLGLSFVEQENGHCIFLEEKSGQPICVIQAVKPQQCKDFPNKWNFPGWQNKCAATAIPETKEKSDE